MLIFRYNILYTNSFQLIIYINQYLHFKQNLNYIYSFLRILNSTVLYEISLINLEFFVDSISAIATK
jgi:hypothetical protein